MEFWQPWQLWLKMTFVLACAIVLVVGAGGCKLVWMQRNLQKHVKLLQQKQAEQKALMARPSVRERKKKRPDIPFGIRAIESGVEVEGVWISRPTSPATSRMTSRMASPIRSPNRSGATSPAIIPLDPRRQGAETPVSGAVRVLASRSRRQSASRSISDPFGDSKVITAEGDDPDSGSSGSTTYRDLPEAEAGYANVRKPSNHSLHSTSRHGSQPAFYRPTGTPDNYLRNSDIYRRPRNSYIPKHLQSRAMGGEHYDSGDESPYEYIPEEDETEPEAQSSYGRSRQVSATGQTSSLVRPVEASFVTPAGMMPQVAGHSGSWHQTSRRNPPIRSETTSPEPDVDFDPAAPTFQSFVASDPRKTGLSQAPSYEDQLRHIMEEKGRVRQSAGSRQSARMAATASPNPYGPRSRTQTPTYAHPDNYRPNTRTPTSMYHPNNYRPHSRTPTSMYHPDNYRPQSKTPTSMYHPDYYRLQTRTPSGVHPENIRQQTRTPVSMYSDNGRSRARTPSISPPEDLPAPVHQASTSTTAAAAAAASRPESSFSSRAEAEAAGSDMRRVNDGFSVSRHGVRRDRESLIAEAQELREERAKRDKDKDKEREKERGRERDTKPADGLVSDREGRRKLQKKRASAALATATTAAAAAASSSSNARSFVAPGTAMKNAGRTSQFKEQM